MGKKKKSSRVVTAPVEPLTRAIRQLPYFNYPIFAGQVFLTITGEQISNDHYVEVLYHAAMQFYDGKIRKLLLSLPQRHGKTSIFTVALIAWILAHHPERKILIISYNEDLARMVADQVRDVLSSDWFKAISATRIRVGHNRSMDFGTTAGGGVYARHLGRGITGRGADYIFIDDPSDVVDAADPAKLAEAIDVFESIVRYRLNHQREGQIAVIAHRIHRHDLIGHLLAEGDFLHINLPLFEHEDVAYDIPGGKWLRPKGELLRAGEFTAAQLTAMQNRESIPDFSTFWLGKPLEAAWNLSEDDFRAFDNLPFNAGGTVLSIDTAYAHGERNSASVVLIWRSSPTAHFLIDVWRAQVSPVELEQTVRRIVNRSRASVVLIEEAGLGVALAANLAARARRVGVTVELIPTKNRSKIARFSDVVPILQARAVWLPRGALWVPEYLDELLTFPDAVRDDQVDATAMYLHWQKTHPSVTAPPPRFPVAVWNAKGPITPRKGGPDESPIRGIYIWRPRKK